MGWIDLKVTRQDHKETERWFLNIIQKSIAVWCPRKGGKMEGAKAKKFDGWGGKEVTKERGRDRCVWR